MLWRQAVSVVAHLDVEILVNFDRLAEGEDVLHDTCELPHTSDLLK